MSMTSQLSVQVPRAWQQQSMRRRRGCRFWCSIARRLAEQAGASARIKNYLGFPTGITGMALITHVFYQAQKFGAQFAIPAQVVGLSTKRR